MALTFAAKKAFVKQVREQLEQAELVVTAEYRGLDVSQMTELRKRARSEDIYLRVLKNSLVRQALEGTPFLDLAEHLTGQLIYGISRDPVAAARVLEKYSKSNEKLSIRGGMLKNSMLDAASVKALASMPTREELLATLMGTMQAPVGQFVRTLNEVPTKLVRALAAIRDQKQVA